MSEQLIQTPAQFGDNGNFLLERALGEGGMGGVYMGRDKMLDRPVAVKVMTKELGSDPEFVDKFRKEAQAVARLIHPNIAQVYSYGISDGMPYIAMELVPGGSLYQVMKNSPSGTDIPRIMKIGEQLAQALRCAADQGLVHGDVKPENVLLDANGNAKLVDFGLAAMQKDTSEIWGTPYYIAPEKVLKEAVDFRADMYSLGGTLYHALTGMPPFEGSDTTAVVKRRFEPGALKKPSEIRSDISPAIDALIMKMMAVAKEQRFPSFEALLQEFNKVMTTGLVKTDEASPSERKTVKHRLTLRRPGQADESASADGDSAEPRPIGKFKKFKVKNVGDEPMEEGNSSESEEGGVGGKVALVVGGTILAIAAVAGFLFWYVAHNAKVKEEEERAQIESQMNAARTAVEKTRKAVADYQVEFDTFSENAVKEAQRATDALAPYFDASVARQLKLPPTQKLLDAQEKLREKSKEELEAEAAKAATPAVTETATKPSDSAPPVVASTAARPRFRDPVEDEADPASPDGQRYLEEKRKWEEEQSRLAAQPVASVEPPAVTESAPAAAKTELDRIAEDAVATCHELWERAYSCQADALLLHHRIDLLLKQCDLALQASVSADKDSATKLATASRDIVNEFECIKASTEFDNIKKGIGFIKSRGASVIDQTVKRIRSEKLRAEREQKKLQEQEEEKRRQEEAKAKHEAKTAEEISAIGEKFEALVTAGVVAQLDWKGAERQLKALSGDFVTAEGQLAAERVIAKVDAMRFAHEVMKRNLKGYVFRKGRAGQPILGYKVVEVDDNGIKMLKADGKTPMKMTWKKFYAEYRGNMNELINQFIVNGKKNGNPTLKLKEWSNAMLGTALTMRLICSDAASAMERAEQIAKDAVTKYRYDLPRAKEYFPDIDFSKIGEDD